MDSKLLGLLVYVITTVAFLAIVVVVRRSEDKQKETKVMKKFYWKCKSKCAGKEEVIPVYAKTYDKALKIIQKAKDLIPVEYLGWDEANDNLVNDKEESKDGK